MEIERCLVLPPKRFQQVDDPKFDPIRPKVWFSRLAERRAKLGRLAAAYDLMTYHDMNQRQAAEATNVDQRELRDYRDFVNGKPRKRLNGDQTILNHAYGFYCDAKGNRSMVSCIEILAPLYGYNKRRVTELWEVDPTFYPDGYIMR